MVEEAERAQPSPPAQRSDHTVWTALLDELVRVVRTDASLRAAVRGAARQLIELLDREQVPTAESHAAAAETAGTEPEDVNETIAMVLQRRERERKGLADVEEPRATWSTFTTAPADLKGAAPAEPRTAVTGTVAVGPAYHVPPSRHLADRVTSTPIEPLSHDRDLLRRWSAHGRLKARAARWMAERQRRIARDADWTTEILPGDHEIHERGQHDGVQLWMCRPDAPVPEDPSRWSDLAGNYEALADILEHSDLVLEQPNADDLLEEVLPLVAEAQSALRVAVASLDEREDALQVDVFRWLRHVTDQRRIYVSRHMRLNDPADHGAWGELRARICDYDDELRAEIERRSQAKKLWGRLRYHLGFIERDPQGDHRNDWAKMLSSVDALVEGGLPPSSIELRDTLLRWIDRVPDELELGGGTLLVMREIDRYLATREIESAAKREADDGPTGPVSPELARARSLLRGRAMVLIGGIHRPGHAMAIQEAFGLDELIWLDGGSPSYTQFEPAIARDDVAVIILMIRWSSHGYGDVKAYCDVHDKPLVRLPGGYNPNQLAFRILEQAGHRLAEAVT